jgi:DNA-binding NarL/FixJ family response regulator
LPHLPISRKDAGVQRMKNPRQAKGVRPRVLLADTEALIVEALRALLEGEFQIVGLVTDCSALFSECRRRKPDVVVLDGAMPGLRSLDVGRELAAAHPSARLVYLTNSSDPRATSEAARLGAVCYVLKSASAVDLKRAIRRAMSGRLQHMEVMTSRSESGGDPADDLTLRQREVLRLIAEGRSMKEVAHILHVTPRTVAFHKYNIMARLRVRSTAELVRFAVKHGELVPAVESRGRGSLRPSVQA